LKIARCVELVQTSWTDWRVKWPLSSWKAPVITLMVGHRRKSVAKTKNGRTPK
jgi:hypothetical protein